jgi:hypothetical protein
MGTWIVTCAFFAGDCGDVDCSANGCGHFVRRVGLESLAHQDETKKTWTETWKKLEKRHGDGK